MGVNDNQAISLVIYFFSIPCKLERTNISLKYSETCIKHGAWRRLGRSGVAIYLGLHPITIAGFVSC